MTKLIAPNGKKLRDIRDERLYSEVVCKDKDAKFFVLADSEDDPIAEVIDGVTLDERVSDLEDAVIELAGIIAEV